MKFSRIPRHLHFIIFLFVTSSGHVQGAPSAPLKRFDPYQKLPDGCVAVLGEQRHGFPSRVNPYQSAQVSRVGKSDFWLISGQEGRQIVMTKLDREIGECRLSQLIEAGGRWSLSQNARNLFAGRWEDSIKPTYSLFEVKSNEWLWTFKSADVVLATAFSHDQKAVLVLVLEAESDNSVALVWLDRVKGDEQRRVKLPGNGKVFAHESLGSVIVDTAGGAFICKNAADDHPLYFVEQKSGKVRPLLEGKEEFGAHDDNWNVQVQAGQGSVVAFHHGQKLYLFANDAGKLSPIHEVQAGSGQFVNDDIINVHFNDAGDRLVVGSLQQTMVVDLAEPDQILKRLDSGSATSDFSADGEFLVFWGRGGAWPYRVSDWTSIRDERTKNEAFHCCPVEVVSFSPESGRVATGDGHRFLVWKLGTDEPIAHLASSRDEKNCQMNSIAWGAEGKFLLGADGWDILQWDLFRVSTTSAAQPLLGRMALGGVKSSSQRKLLQVATDESGKHAVVIDRKTATYFDLDRPGASRTLKIDPTDFNYRPRSFSVDGENQRVFFSTSANAQVVSFDGSADPIYQKLGPTTNRTLRGWSGEIFVAGNSKDRKNDLLHSKVIESGETTSTLELEGGSLNLRSIIVSPDGSHLLLIKGGKLVVMKWDTKEVLREISLPVGYLSGAFSADNKYLALGAVNRATYLWKVGK